MRTKSAASKKNGGAKKAGSRKDRFTWKNGDATIYKSIAEWKKSGGKPAK